MHFALSRYNDGVQGIEGSKRKESFGLLGSLKHSFNMTLGFKSTYVKRRRIVADCMQSIFDQPHVIARLPSTGLIVTNRRIRHHTSSAARNRGPVKLGPWRLYAIHNRTKH
jgi:hypothetical protein